MYKSIFPTFDEIKKGYKVFANNYYKGEDNDDEHEHYYVKPIDRHNFITFPLEDLGGTVMVTIDEYLGLRANYYQFTEDLKGIELYAPPTNIEIADETFFKQN